MRTHLSGAIVRSVTLVPPLAKAGLLLASRLFPNPHWIVSHIATELDYRVRVNARLGNGMNLDVFWPDVVGTGILVNGYHEPGTVSVVQRILKPGMVFVDIGAQVGQYTLLAASMVGSKGFVHSFEPDPISFPVLCKNVATNRLQNVSVKASAIGSHCGSAFLYAGTAQNIGTASLNAVEGSIGRVKVECITLDSYVESQKISKVDLIKIDVEGAELDVLNGASNLLGSDSKPDLIVEFAEANQVRFGRTYGQIADCLLAHDYELLCISREGMLLPYKPWGPEYAYFNVLAQPSKKEVKLSKSIQ